MKRYRDVPGAQAKEDDGGQANFGYLGGPAETVVNEGFS
jgi:hypothetical protein